MRPPIHNPTKPHCFLTQLASNPEASRTNAPEETQCTWPPWLAPTGVAGARWDKDTPSDQALPNPGDARPIVHRPTDLPVAAGYDTAWARTQSLWWHSWRCSTAPLTTAPPGNYGVLCVDLWRDMSSQGVWMLSEGSVLNQTRLYIRVICNCLER